MATKSNPETPLVLASIESWIKEYQAGSSCPEIADKYGVNKSTVHRRLKDQGVKIRSRSEAKLAERNPMWRGDDVRYYGLHTWVKQRIPKSEKCDNCHLKAPIDLANISDRPNPETYNRELKNWRWLCRKCHMLEDGRLDRMYHGGAKPINIECVVCYKPHKARGLCTKHYSQLLNHGAIISD